MKSIVSRLLLIGLIQSCILHAMDIHLAEDQFQREIDAMRAQQKKSKFAAYEYVMQKCYAHQGDQNTTLCRNAWQIYANNFLERPKNKR